MYLTQSSSSGTQARGVAPSDPGSRSPQVDDVQTRIERSGGRNAAVREGRARETRICGLEVVMVEAREQGVFNLDDRDESRVKKKDKTQIHSIYIFDPRSYFH